MTETVDATSLAPVNPASIKMSLRGKGCLPDGQEIDDLAMRFVRDLISDRSIDDLGVHFAAPSVLSDPTPALLALATTLLTCLYREAAAASQRPLAPRGNDRVYIAPANHQRHHESLPNYLSQLETTIGELLQSAPADAVDHVLIRILQGIKQPVPEIARLDLQILTEFCWLKLIEQSPVYHGWTDLLSAIARRDIAKPQTPYSYPPRPMFDTSGMTHFITESYSRVTARSWNDRQRGTSSAVSMFFDAIANVLHEQSRLRASYHAANKPPVVSAFSTSFDLELEMALASKNELEGFIVALPVNCVRRRDGTATLHWLGAVVDRPRQLSDIQKPLDWVLLSGASWNEIWGSRSGRHKRFSDLPVVVRLAGCPLISLPDAVKMKELFNEAKVPSSEFVEVEPALLLDEYRAIQHHSTEVFAPHLRNSLGLPEQLTWKSEQETQYRFWLVMGVQMDDAAIRFRVATRLGDGRKGRSTEVKEREIVAAKEAVSKSEKSDTHEIKSRAARPDRAGLVVTRNLAPAARDLMPWFAVDVVEGSCVDFVPDLQHYIEHLRDSSPWIVDHYTKPCRFAKP